MFGIKILGKDLIPFIMWTKAKNRYQDDNMKENGYI